MKKILMLLIILCSTNVIAQKKNIKEYSFKEFQVEVPGDWDTISAEEKKVLLDVGRATTCLPINGDQSEVVAFYRNKNIEHSLFFTFSEMQNLNAKSIDLIRMSIESTLNSTVDILNSGEHFSNVSYALKYKEGSRLSYVMDLRSKVSNEYIAVIYYFFIGENGILMATYNLHKNKEVNDEIKEIIESLIMVNSYTDNSEYNYSSGFQSGGIDIQKIIELNREREKYTRNIVLWVVFLILGVVFLVLRMTGKHKTIQENNSGSVQIENEIAITKEEQVQESIEELKTRLKNRPDAAFIDFSLLETLIPPKIYQFDKYISIIKPGEKICYHDKRIKLVDDERWKALEESGKSKDFKVLYDYKQKTQV